MGALSLSVNAQPAPSALELFQPLGLALLKGAALRGSGKREGCLQSENGIQTSQMSRLTFRHTVHCQLVGSPPTSAGPEACVPGITAFNQDSMCLHPTAGTPDGTLPELRRGGLQALQWLPKLRVQQHLTERELPAAARPSACD